MNITAPKLSVLALAWAREALALYFQPVIWVPRAFRSFRSALHSTKNDISRYQIQLTLSHERSLGPVLRTLGVFFVWGIVFLLLPRSSPTKFLSKPSDEIWVGLALAFIASILPALAAFGRIFRSTRLNHKTKKKHKKKKRKNGTSTQ